MEAMRVEERMKCIVRVNGEGEMSREPWPSGAVRSWLLEDQSDAVRLRVVSSVQQLAESRSHITRKHEVRNSCLIYTSDRLGTTMAC